jgi:phage shock protein PspC (stress-responsive transcriptional regulator)
MDKTIVVGLSGHAGEYRLDEEAHDRLTRYLDRAARRVPDDSERAEVLGDLERSIGDKLDAQLGTDQRLITAADIDAVLEEIGAVDTGHEPVAEEADTRPRRRLYRIREGQQIAGVCTGIAARYEVGVDWVRTGFWAATIVTLGIFLVIYITLAFALPVVDKAGMRPRPRRLYRVREGQQIAGVCNGLAAYAELRVDWVRTVFFFASLLTLGAFTLVYVALVVILPIASTGDSYQTERR